MKNRIELQHDENYADLLDIKRDLYTVGGSVAFDQDVLRDGYEVLRSGGAGFLSISSPAARIPPRQNSCRPDRNLNLS